MMKRPQDTMYSDENDNAQYVFMCRQEQQYMAKNCLIRTPHPVDEECRRKMVVWFYQAADYYEVDRETVEICVNFLDRFLASDAVSTELTCKKDFQLMAITCFYTAIKIYEPAAIDSVSMARLSRGKYAVKEIEACERRLLHGLSWRMNPPTTMGFVRIRLRDMSVSKSVERQVLQLTKKQLQAAVHDYSIMTSVLPSVLAEGALSNSIRAIGKDVKGLPGLVSLVDKGIADWLARALPTPPPTLLTTKSTSAKRESFVRSESRGGLSPKSVCFNPTPPKSPSNPSRAIAARGA